MMHVALFERILLAIDHSGHAQEASRVAGHLATAFGSTIEVLHVLEAPVAAAIGPADGLETDVDARALVAAQVAVLRSRGIAAEGAVDSGGGLLADQVLAAARRSSADLVALGAVGPGTLNPLAIGSVAHAVVSRADRPVLVARQSHRLEPGRLIPTVTVGVDGSPESLRAAALGAAVARRLGSDLQLVAVAAEAPFDLEDLVTELASRAREDGIRAEGEFCPEGDPADEIDTRAGRRAGGLVVVGRRGHGAAEALGGVAHRLLRRTWLPVLVVAGHTELPSL